MASATAATKDLFRIERDDRVPALPDAFSLRVAPEADATAERPDADKVIQMTECGSDAGGDCVCVVQGVNRRIDIGLAQQRGERRREILPLHLLQVRRLFNDAIANHARKADADRADLLSAARRDLARDALRDLFRRHLDQTVKLTVLVWKDVRRADELMIIN